MTKLISCFNSAEEQKAKRVKIFIFIQICKQFNTENVERNACSEKPTLFFPVSAKTQSHFPSCNAPLEFQSMESKPGFIASICINCCNKKKN